ncbi:hypothetical protein LQK93_01450 [Terrabacter sp. BE26]
MLVDVVPVLVMAMTVMHVILMVIVLQDLTAVTW